ncbi:MAG TPA: beta-L-arabinofuranosidase domain-containing protein [Candidatus Limnocylindrales bacterium]|nr:beta-L-arabinofuranosidase domain-containing protein [Candidatus Limnocylindrales bacterium]
MNRRKFAMGIMAGAAAPLVAQQTTTQTHTTEQSPRQPGQPVPAGPPDPNTARRRPGPPPEVPPFEGKIEFARKDVAPKTRPFEMGEVKLLPSMYTEVAEWNSGYMDRLPADRLLYNFRQNAGLSVGDAKPLGGWEAPADGKRGTELRGHFTGGHFLSATAQRAANGDKDAKSKGDYMVAELAKCQEKLGGGYLSAFPTELFDRLDALSGKPRSTEPGAPQLPWAPFYTIHKIMAGLLDMNQIAGNKQALDVVEKMADWTDKWTGSKSEEHMQEILGDEYGGMAEVLYNLSAATNNDQWARVGDRFTKKRFVNPLASRRDELRGLHVNTHIPQVIAAARRYEISDDTRFHDVADFFWYEVTTARAYVTGGTSNGESWQGQPRELAHELKMSVATAECCCAYNMLKLTRHLHSWTADPRYFDYYEKVLLNHRIGTIQPKSGYTQYYLSLTPGAWKTFNTEDQSFWCCTGTGVEEYSKLNNSIYWHDGDGLYVNLFVPSELDWNSKGFKLRQETKFPETPSTTLTVTAARGSAMPIRLRIPGWLRTAPTVKVNGRVLEASAAPGSYLTIHRAWKAGDKVEMEMPMHLGVVEMPDDHSMQAFVYGPIVLAGDLGSEGLTERMIVGPNAPRIPRPGFNGRPRNPDAPPQVPAIEIPTFKARGDVSSWIKPADGPLRFRTTGQSKDVALVPINSIFGKRYSVYWTVS